MAKADVEREFHKEIDEVRGLHPQLKPDELFVRWFLRAYLTEEDESATRALVGAPKDGGVDAILIDDEVKKVFLVQGKYRHRLAADLETRGAVIAFAKLASIFWKTPTERQEFLEGLDPLVRKRLEQAIDRIRKREYVLQMYFATTGRCSESIRREAEETAMEASISTDGEVAFDVIQGQDILTLYNDYVVGAAPPVPYVTLPIGPNASVRDEGVIRRYDAETGIESWVFTADGRDLGALFSNAGTRLFARNIRGFLGNTEINQSIRATLKDEPENFWYYNNGVTIVCDEARQVREKGRDLFRIKHPQVINGQQTTRMLAQGGKANAGVLVRLIRIPRQPGVDTAKYDKMVSSIVRATNWQNKITRSDLMSNDSRQVYLERELKRIGYQYIRKRQTKGEARRAAGSRAYWQIKKDELAQAVAACELDPLVVREGKEGLFDEPYYSAIFGSSQVYFYLARYWMMRQVQSAGRGRPEWAYAKWIVLNHIWKSLPYQTSGRARLLVKACEDDDFSLSPLQTAILSAFRAAMRYYRLNRGKGEKARDVSTFFKRKKVHLEFQRFWRGTRNPHRQTFSRAITRHLRELREIEEA